MTKGAGMISKPKMRVVAARAEVRADEGVVVSGLLAQGALDAVEDFDEIGSGAAARVEHLHVGAGEAEGFVQFGAQEMIDALHHVADDFARGVPDAEFLAQLGIEGFKEGLVEVLDGVFLAEGCEEVALNAVEGVGGVVEDFGDLDGVQRAGLGDGVEEGAENGDAEVLGGETPVEDAAVRGKVRRAAPENPGGEDAVEKCLDEGGTEEVLAFFSFKGDAERFLERGFNPVKGDDGMLGGAFAGFACVGGEEFGDVLWFFEGDFTGEDAGQEIRKGFGMAFGEIGNGQIPKVVGGASEIVTFHHRRSAVAEFDKLELVIIGDEAEPVFVQVAANLVGLGERGEAFAGWFDFNRAAFGALARHRRRLSTIGDRKKTAVRKVSAAVPWMGDKDNTWLESLAYSIEYVRERSVKGGFGGVRAE